ncbi:MAG: MFS transporter [Methanotrichaceae archaeon]|nr:MFS transporter [Methanotrichaceae archaeon]
MKTGDIDKGTGRSSGYISRVKSFSQNARLYLLFVLLTTFNVGIYGVIFNLYILRLGFREDFLGLILSLSSVSVGLFAIPAAFICDRWGPKRTLLLSYAILSVSLLVLYTATTQEILVIASTAQGIALSLSLVTGATFMVENSSAYERMHLFSLYYVVYTLSMLLGNLIGGLLPSLLAGVLSSEQGDVMAYRLTLYLSLAATLLSVLPLCYIKGGKPKEKAAEKQLSIYRSVIREENVRRMVLVFCLIGLGWGTSLPYFNVYFDQVLGASTAQIGTIFSLSQLVMAAGYFLVPVLTGRMGKILMASVVQAVSIPFLLVFAFTSSIIVAAFGYVMRYLLMNMANPVLNSYKLEIVASEQRPIINSLSWMACYTFAGIGTYAGGIMMAGGWYCLPFLVTSAIYAATALLFYAYFRRVEEIDKSESELTA